jgi:hypothetical protein
MEVLIGLAIGGVVVGGGVLAFKMFGLKFQWPVTKKD